MKIYFNKPCLTGSEKKHLIDSIASHKMSGDGKFSQQCCQWFEGNLKCEKVFLTPSCTHALEMTAILLDIKKNDEVIMPSYTFVSTANAFVLRGAKIVFVDIRTDTMNIDETKIEQAVTSKTKVIIPVHYAGVACEMDTIMNIADRHNIFVVEDAAQGMMSSYKERALGTIGHFGVLSFHETKNYTSGGEGGLLIINDKRFLQRAEIIREKGTNRSQFFKGLVDKYSWVDIGSSYLMNDISAAYLWGQLEEADTINNNRFTSWNLYYKGLKHLEEKGFISLPVIPKECKHNAHMFYIKAQNLETRDNLLEYLNKDNISANFHYMPLHSSQFGKIHCSFSGVDTFTKEESVKLLRLPLYYKLTAIEVQKVVNRVVKFFDK
jgi:dTDP-4-amino-4,6-dideoxygalactose transaminase